MRDLKSHVAPAQSLAPAARTASANGTGVDLANYDSALAVIDVGAWTDGTHTFEVQESDDDVTYTAVAAADLDGAEPVVDGATKDDQIYLVGYRGTKRYVRVAVTAAGTTTGAVYGAEVVRGRPRKLT